MKVTVTELRPQLTKILEQVKAGETVQIVKGGTVIAHIVPPVEQISMPVNLSAEDRRGAEALEIIMNGTFDRSKLIEEAKRKDRERLDILRGINKKPRS